MATAGADVDAALDGHTALALRLAKHLAPPPAWASASAPAAAAARGGGNVAFSPVSVHAALALVAAGARGATLAQLLAFLSAPSAAALAELGRRVSACVLGDRTGAGGPRVLFGGGVWVDASRGELDAAFRGVAAESYKSDARNVSFADEPEEAVKVINNCVKKATNSFIDTVISVSDINADTDLVLANAVYFKGEWENPFQWTSPGTFHLLDGSHAKADFMSNFTMLRVAFMDGFKVVRLPYKQGRVKRRRSGGDGAGEAEAEESAWPDSGEANGYSMFVFLPDARGGLSTMVDVVTASPAFMYGILDYEMELQHVDLKLPKFKISSSWGNLGDTLCQLGLTLPFSPEAADLHGMCKGEVDDGYDDDDDDENDDEDDGAPRRPMFLTKLAHTAVVNVHEKGTEAAAAAFIMRGGGGSEHIVDFTADHPFTFFIMEERSGVIVFAGHVLDPTQ